MPRYRSLRRSCTLVLFASCSLQKCKDPSDRLLEDDAYASSTALAGLLEAVNTLAGQ